MTMMQSTTVPLRYSPKPKYYFAASTWKSRPVVSAIQRSSNYFIEHGGLGLKQEMPWRETRTNGTGMDAQGCFDALQV